ncbi:MAG: helix-turn-helix domain-containing protein [Burkholderiaceae bacterium]
MAAVVQASGAITIADVVREAGVSKRSFYEHFESKEACFLALYAAASAPPPCAPCANHWIPPSHGSIR